MMLKNVSGTQLLTFLIQWIISIQANSLGLEDLESHLRALVQGHCYDITVYKGK